MMRRRRLVRNECDRNLVLDVIIDMRINHVMAVVVVVPKNGGRGATASDGVHQLLLEDGRHRRRWVVGVQRVVMVVVVIQLVVV